MIVISIIQIWKLTPSEFGLFGQDHTNNECATKTLTQVMLTLESKLLTIITENKDVCHDNFFARL